MRRRRLVPEVVQTSSMDCGPAALTALLKGHGLTADYPALRLLCQTGLDGTSVDILEELAVSLGLDAEQILLPSEHVLDALPALIVTRLPDGATHFVVLWSRLGSWVQVMDPAVGRVWRREGRVRADLYKHQMTVDAEDYREFVHSSDYVAAMRRRLREARVGRSAAEAQLEAALSDPDGAAMSRLDAAVRLLRDLSSTHRGLRRRADAVLETLVREVAQAEDPTDIIPAGYWSGRVVPEDEEGTPQVHFRGAVLVRALGLLEEGADPEVGQPLLDARPSRPGLTLARLVAADGVVVPVALGLFACLIAVLMVVEALALRGFLEVGAELALPEQRGGALAVLMLLSAALLGLGLGAWSGALTLGRRLEGRLRLALRRKLPRLPLAYFSTRLRSDLAERAHALGRVRRLPQQAVTLVRAASELAVTVAAIAWLEPRAGPLAAATALVAIAVPFAFQPVLVERDLRMRTQSGALSRYYLDALQGLLPIRTHGAEEAVQRSHEELLAEWWRSGQRVVSAQTWLTATEAAVGAAGAVAIFLVHARQHQATPSALLLAYWALNLPHLASQVGSVLRLWPLYRNRTLRSLEILEARDAHRPTASQAPPPEGPIGVSFEQVVVTSTGGRLLDDVDLTIHPGEHVAVVGPSGAGKSTLLSALLGFHDLAGGTLRLGGVDLAQIDLDKLRERIAIVDAELNLWNASLLANLRYGAGSHGMAPPLDLADLVGVVARLPQGLATEIGDGGGMLSGGEGQRVRLGRALGRPGAGLVILDEPFRGLDGSRRREMLHRARTYWRDATLVCVTHDVEQAAGFPRVLVVERGRIEEDDAPAVLLDLPDGRFRQLHDAAVAARSEVWRRPGWRQLWVADGHVEERLRPGPEARA